MNDIHDLIATAPRKYRPFLNKARACGLIRDERQVLVALAFFKEELEWEMERKQKEINRLESCLEHTGGKG